MRVHFAAVHESENGTKLPNPDVRYPVAIGAKSRHRPKGPNR